MRRARLVTLPLAPFPTVLVLDVSDSSAVGSKFQYPLKGAFMSHSPAHLIMFALQRLAKLIGTTCLVMSVFASAGNAI